MVIKLTGGEVEIRFEPVHGAGRPPASHGAVCGQGGGSILAFLLQGCHSCRHFPARRQHLGLPGSLVFGGCAFPPVSLGPGCRRRHGKNRLHGL